jgi:hypothetical protein
MARAKRIRVQVKVNARALRELREHPEVVLRHLDEPVRRAARRILDISTFLVPRGGAPNDPLDLADTGFVSGPLFRFERERLSVTWTCGWAHPAAGAIHEGFHFGQKLLPPPHFLRRAVKGMSAALKKPVGGALMQALAALPKG